MPHTLRHSPGVIVAGNVSVTVTGAAANRLLLTRKMVVGDRIAHVEFASTGVNHLLRILTVQVTHHRLGQGQGVVGAAVVAL